MTEEELETRDVTPAPIVPEPPNWLSRRGRGNWEYLVPELEKNNLATKRDRESIGFMCEQAAICVESLLLLRDENNGYGNLLQIDKGHQNRLSRHPAYLIFSNAVVAFERSAKQFGLTPRMRIGLGVAGAGITPAAMAADTSDDAEVFGW